MSEKLGFIPKEAQETNDEATQEIPLKEVTKLNIQQGPSETTPRPEAVGMPHHWKTTDGNLITPEKEEIYRSPETLPEKEPGFGPKPAWSDTPGMNTLDDMQSADDTQSVPTDDTSLLATDDKGGDDDE
jgi:hypothetical protein